MEPQGLTALYGRRVGSDSRTPKACFKTLHTPGTTSSTESLVQAWVASTTAVSLESDAPSKASESALPPPPPCLLKSTAVKRKSSCTLFLAAGVVPATRLCEAQHAGKEAWRQHEVRCRLVPPFVKRCIAQLPRLSSRKRGTSPQLCSSSMKRDMALKTTFALTANCRIGFGRSVAVKATLPPTPSRPTRP